MDANAIEQREVKIGQRHWLLVANMATALQAGAGAASDQDREVVVIMKARITHAAAVHIDRMIEKRSSAVGSGSHFLGEFRKQGHMERVDRSICSNFPGPPPP